MQAPSTPTISSPPPSNPFSCDAEADAATNPLCYAWIKNAAGPNQKTSEFVAGVIVDVEQATSTTLSGAEFMQIRSSNIPGGSFLMTQEHVNKLALRPTNVDGDTTNDDWVADLSLVGNKIKFGDNVGFVVAPGQGCTTPSAGYWPATAPCPYNRNKITNIPKSQTPATRTCYQMLGAVGIAVDGVSIYGWTNANSYLNQWAWNWIGQKQEEYIQDLCNGHASSWNEYHYSGEMPCLSERLGDDGTAASPILGFAVDGSPILGKWNAAGQKYESCWKARDYSHPTLGCPDGKRSCKLVNQWNPSCGITTLSALDHGPDPAGTIQVPDGHTVSAASGIFFEDWYWDSTCSAQGGTKLDAHNGRFDTTLQKYVYHVTETFPYTIGPSFAFEIDTDNGLQSVCQIGPVFTIFSGDPEIPTLPFTSRGRQLQLVDPQVTVDIHMPYPANCNPPPSPPPAAPLQGDSTLPVTFSVGTTDCGGKYIAVTNAATGTDAKVPVYVYYPFGSGYPCISDPATTVSGWPVVRQYTSNPPTVLDSIQGSFSLVSPTGEQTLSSLHYTSTAAVQNCVLYQSQSDSANANPTGVSSNWQLLAATGEPLGVLPCAPPSPPPPDVASPSQPPPAAPPTDTCSYTETNRLECACGEVWTLTLREMLPAWDLSLAWPADSVRLQYGYQGLYGIAGAHDTMLYDAAAFTANQTSMTRTPATPPTSGHIDVMTAKVPGERFDANAPLVSLRYPPGSSPAFPKPNGAMVNGYIGWLMGADTGNFHPNSMVQRVYDTAGQNLAQPASCWFQTSNINADYFFGIQNPIGVLSGSYTPTFSVRIQAFHTRPMLKSVNFRIHIDPTKVAFRYACIGPEPASATCQGPLASTLGVHQARWVTTSASPHQTASSTAASAGSSNSSLPRPAADSMPFSSMQIVQVVSLQHAQVLGTTAVMENILVGDTGAGTSPFSETYQVYVHAGSDASQYHTMGSSTTFVADVYLDLLPGLATIPAQHEVLRLEAQSIQGQTTDLPPQSVTLFNGQQPCLGCTVRIE